MTDYAKLADNMTSTDAGWACTIPDGWRQGRTAYGGITAALSLEAA